MTKKKTASESTCAPVLPPGYGSPTYAYTPECWGERGTDELGSVRADRLHGSAFARKAAHEADPLVYAFVGRDSRLVWWTGPNGLLTTSMPVLSEDQVEGDDSSLVGGERRPLRDLLADLWYEWRETTPSKAAALVEWVEKAILVTEALRSDMVQKSLDFVRFEEQDFLEDVPGELFRQAVNFREHHPEAILAWFRSNAWQYRTTDLGEMDDRPALPPEQISKGDNMKWAKPRWFEDADPILSLPKAEQAELLTLLEAMTGQPVGDTSPRFAPAHGGPRKASYKDIGDFISLAREYERLLAEVSESKWASEPLSREELTSNLETRDVILQALDTILARWNSSDLDHAAMRTPRMPSRSTSRRESYADRSPYGALVRGRQRSRAVGERTKAEGSRKSFKDFLQERVEAMFGLEAAGDIVVLTMLGADDQSPMAAYRDLLRVNRRAGTIVHSDEFKRDFALTVGTHSECAARRIARNIWEAYMQDARVSRREDELSRIVNVMASYRMPCSPEQEAELRALLPSSGKSAFASRWDTTEKEVRRVYEGALRQDVAEHLEEEQKHLLGSEDAAEIAPRGFIRKLSTVRKERATPNAATRRFVLNPVHFAFSRASAR